MTISEKEKVIIHLINKLTEIILHFDKDDLIATRARSTAFAQLSEVRRLLEAKDE